MKQRIWFERRFTLGLGLEAFPELLERIRGTPARLEERVREFSSQDWIRRVDERWSIQENVGHLLDLEPLWLGRLHDLEAGAPVLREADLENRATHEAQHNARSMLALLHAFRGARRAFVRALEGTDPRIRERVALHPRLEQPMTLTDLMFFVAEHDDHHLARIGTVAEPAPLRSPEDVEAYRARARTLLGSRDPVDSLAAFPDVLRAQLASLGPERFEQRAPGGGWTLREVLSHLADTELVYGHRIRLALVDALPEFPSFDQERWTDRWGALESAPERILTVWATHRTWNVGLLRTVAPEEWDREGLHPTRGPETVRQMVRLWAAHDLIHQEQVRRILEQ